MRTPNAFIVMGVIVDEAVKWQSPAFKAKDLKG
jgi:hypothetical protein